MREATLFALASLSEQLVDLEVCAFYFIPLTYGRFCNVVGF